MLGWFGFIPATIAMSWTYEIARKGIHSAKDSFISYPTCYITLYSTRILSYRLVTRTSTAAYTKNIIPSAFKTVRIWPVHTGKEYIPQSQKITLLECPPATSNPLISLTPHEENQFWSLEASQCV